MNKTITAICDLCTDCKRPTQEEYETYKLDDEPFWGYRKRVYGTVCYILDADCHQVAICENCLTKMLELVRQ